MALKEEILAESTLYQGKKKPPFRATKWIFRPLRVLGCLLVAHFLNVYLQWTVISRDLAGKPSFDSPEYTLLGFSPLHNQEITAARRLPNAAPTGRVFAFFDFFHPVVFMIWNNGGDGDFFDLGPVMAALPVGASRISFSPGSIFVLRHGEKTVARNFGGSIFGAFWARSLNENNNGSNPTAGRLPGSFIVKPAAGSASLRIPYLVYFYLPLALIVILIATTGPGLATAFFYYAGMFFLFDFEKLLAGIPLDWLFGSLSLELADPWIKVLAVGLALIFLAAAVYGLLRWKSAEMPPSSKWIVWFFILLPFFLFF